MPNQKIALVTGASRGLGGATAEALAAAGYHVIALARTIGGLEDLDDRIKSAGGTATLVPLDITDEGGLQRLCLSIFERWGKLDLWVHAAIFVGPLSPAGHVPEKDWDKSVAINIHATQRLISLLGPLLDAAHGKAVLPVDDVAGHKFQAAYGSAKAAQSALWTSWAAEVSLNSCHALTFAPKPMPTALRGRFYPGEDRSILTHPRTEAARLLKTLGLDQS